MALRTPDRPAVQSDRFDDRYPLDRAVAGLRQEAPWRRGAVISVLAVLVIAFVVSLVVDAAGLPRHGDVTGAYGLVGEVLLGVVVVGVARPIARRVGGWRDALGLGPPLRSDLRRVFAWFGIQLGVRIGLAILLVAVSAGSPTAGNLTGVEDLGTAGLVMLVVGAVVVAPIVEELAFRGVLLRALMRRLSYWPAAGISSVVFAALHMPEVDTWRNAGFLFLFIYAFGLLQCQLVRRTGRLAPAMGVHALLNLLTIGVALAAR